MADPGLFTDSTGEGMAGALDVSLLTQKNLKQTYYNGSKPCLDCGLMLNPVEAAYRTLCPKCTRRQAVKRVNSRMAE
jgi:predicted RNA-binding Zn-ribbon protein involved in translation (DUF1610 family)